MSEPTDPQPSPGNGSESPPEATTPHGDDASRTEVAIYAFGNVETSVADRFPEILQNILVVAAHMNPILVGLVMGIKTLWDGIMDPIMAHISDNTKTRWGRRRPFILVGGVSRCLFLIAFIAFIPIGSKVLNNELMEAQKHVEEGANELSKQREVLDKAFVELQEADAEHRSRIIDVLQGRPPESWITAIIGIFTSDKDESFITTAEQYGDQIETHLPTLKADLQRREQALAERQADLDRLNARGVPQEDKAYLKAFGLVEAAQKEVETAEALIEKGREALPLAIVNVYATRFLLESYAPGESSETPSVETITDTAASELSAKGSKSLPLFSALEGDPTEVPAENAESTEKRSMLERVTDSVVSLLTFEGLREGFRAFFEPANYEQRQLVLYLMVAYLIFATLSTINNAPYYALGIELSPSYEGRTQVVVYRSIVSKIAGAISPWIPVLCFSLFFVNAFDALFWIAVGAAVVGIPSTVLMFFKTRERTQATIKKAGERPSLFRSMWEIGKERDFLRVLFLFILIGMVTGLFNQIGFYLNVYWVTGSALSGAALQAKVLMLGWALSLIALPVVKWACDKFQKHRVLQFAILWMAIGAALKWWLMNPEHPEYQFLLPFFFSVGIGSIYTVLPAMMADVTDLDELNHGVRREGMFGAVMAFLMKLIGTIIPIAAGVVLVLSGFNAELEYRQAPSTITNMRLLYSFAPAAVLFVAFLIVRNYPLTRERVADIKQQLRERHAAESAQ